MALFTWFDFYLCVSFSSHFIINTNKNQEKKGKKYNTMDIKSMPASEQHQERERQTINILEKLIKHNSEYGADLEHTVNNSIGDHHHQLSHHQQHLEKSLRDVKNFQKIMEKFKIDGSVENLMSDSYKDG